MSKGTLKDPVRTMKRALKFASKTMSRTILTAVHLDPSGDVVSTDSYRMYVEWHAWSGPEMNLDYSTAYDIAHCKVRGNETAVIENDGDKLIVRMGDGTEIIGAVQEGNYPKYGQIIDELETYAMAKVNPKQLLPIVREHIKMGDNMRIEAKGGAFIANGIEGEPAAKFDGCAEGESYVGVDPRFMRDALNIFGSECVVRIMNPIKPMLFTDDENVRVLVMPVRIDAAKPNRKEQDMEKAKKMKVDKHELASALHHAAIDRAAQDKDGRVQAVPCTPKERELLHALRKVERLTHEELGELTSYYLDGEFVCCIERRWSKREIHLTHPELKPVCHRSDLVAARKVADKAKNEGCDVEVEVSNPEDGVQAIEIKPITPPPVKAEQKKEAPKVKAPKAPKKEDTLEKRIAELEAELKKRNAELDEVWKENERLKAAKQASKAPEPKAEPKPAPKSGEVAPAEISLAAMEKWCEGKGLIASQKREGCCIWVEGESKPYADELKEMGFRFAKKRKSWYLDPKQAA